MKIQGEKKQVASMAGSCQACIRYHQLLKYLELLATESSVLVVAFEKS